MNEPLECIRCHVQMEAGFLVDAAQSGFQQQKWSSGKPVPSFWMGLKLDSTQVVPVITLRCPQCGYLESYAYRQPAPDC